MTKNSFLIIFVLTAALVSLSSQSALSEQPNSNQGISEEALEKLKEANDRSNRAAAKHLGIPLASIQACRKVGFPLYFSMFQAVIADEAGLPVEEVNQARLDGYHWGEMCRAWGVSLKKVRSRIQEAFIKMVEEGVSPPSATLAESLRSANTGRRQKPLRGRP